MAQRTRGMAFARACRCSWSSLASFFCQVEEEVAVAVGARDLLRHGRERLVDLPLVLKPCWQHPHLERLALVDAGNDRCRQRNPGIGVWPEFGCRDGRATSGSSPSASAAYTAGRRRWPVPRPVGGPRSDEVAFGQCLHPPDNAFDQPVLVPSVRRLSEHLRVVACGDRRPTCAAARPVLSRRSDSCSWLLVRVSGTVNHNAH